MTYLSTNTHQIAKILTTTCNIRRTQQISDVVIYVFFYITKIDFYARLKRLDVKLSQFNRYVVTNWVEEKKRAFLFV